MEVYKRTEREKSMYFRPYKSMDADAIISWITSETEFYLWSAGILGEYPLTGDQLQSKLREADEDERKFLMVACDEEGPFGFMVLRYLPDEKDVVRFGLVVVDPKKRSQGYGKAMLKMAQKYAFEMLSANKITLGVFETNLQAFRSYLSVGFTEMSQTKEYEILGTTWVCKEMVMFSPDIQIEGSDRIVPEDDIFNKIITTNMFSYAFQPIVDAKSGEIYGYEALMRAECDGKPISPMAILDYAAKHDYMYDIEKLTLFNVMRRYENGLFEIKNRKLFINSLPGYQLTEQDYEDLKSKYGQYFSNFCIEITENTEFRGTELYSLLERSEQDGFGLAIDDYGTGYSNTSSVLSYLPDCVKIDRLLITDINEDTKKQHFVKGMVEFAHTNGILILAEGVETEAELKTVIGMDVDLIQGFYTGRPSFEIIDEIDIEIRNEIASANVKNQTSDTRKIYTVMNEKELPLMRLALEQYSGILVASEEFTLVGNTKYCAEMSIKIKDGCKCRMTIRDVFLESFMQLPCIEIGKNAELTLELQGMSRFRKYGIYVPESSKLIIEGDGDLQLRVQGIQSYAIGSLWDGQFGDICWRGTGSMDILVEADEGIGIGGGHFGGTEGIVLQGGIVRIEPASSHSVAVGSPNGTVPIMVEDCQLQLDIKTERGIGIGCAGGNQNTLIKHSKVNIISAGTCISPIGSYTETEGEIRMENSEVSVLGNGSQLYLIGAPFGALSIVMEGSLVNLHGEGNEIVGIGTADEQAIINARQTDLTIKIASGKPMPYGTKGNTVIFQGGKQSISVNE